MKFPSSTSLKSAGSLKQRNAVKLLVAEPWMSLKMLRFCPQNQLGKERALKNALSFEDKEIYLMYYWSFKKPEVFISFEEV